jgi:hypothetical protein
LRECIGVIEVQWAAAAIDNVEAGINRSHRQATFLGLNHSRDTSQAPWGFAEVLCPMIHFPFANLSVEGNPETSVPAWAYALDIRVRPGFVERDGDQFAVLQFRKGSMSRDPDVPGGIISDANQP